MLYCTTLSGGAWPFEFCTRAHFRKLTGPTPSRMKKKNIKRQTKPGTNSSLVGQEKKAKREKNLFTESLDAG